MSRLLDGMLGFAIGDALGVPAEFKSREELGRYPITDMIGDGTYKVPAGTSLTVQPASGLIEYFKGKNLVLINRDSMSYDDRADLVINDSLGKVFKEI